MTAIVIQTKTESIKIDGYPNQCPWCTHLITPEYAGNGLTYLRPDSTAYVCAELPLICSNKKCNKLFLAVYVHLEGHPNYRVLSDSRRYFTLKHTSPKTINLTTFDPIIKSLSNRFTIVFNEAEAAEQYGLENVAGPGYRKSLEILIKDFLISINPADQVVITHEHKLQKLITERIDHPLLRESVSRAAWLGNDEVHYARTWEDKDVSDLKSLIDIAVTFIAYEIKAQHYIASMPGQLKK
jgi:hypothetical protein